MEAQDELVWTIGSVNIDRLKSNQGIVSPTVLVGSKNDLWGTLHLFTNNSSSSEFLSLSVYLQIADEISSLKFWAYMKCQILEHDKVLASSTAVGTFSHNQNYHLFGNFIRPVDLEKRGGLVIRCFVNILGASIVQVGKSSATLLDREKSIKTQARSDFQVEKSVAPVRRHCKHLKMLGLESIDVTLVSHGEEFPVHRNILAASSTVFSNLFINRAAENADNRIVINDIYPVVLREILCFIYTNQLKKFNLIPNVLEAACKYDLRKLKILCERVLFNSTNPDNVCSILLIADVFHLESLKNWALLVIRAYAEYIIKTPGFQVLKNLKRADLMEDVICQLVLSPR